MEAFTNIPQKISYTIPNCKAQEFAFRKFICFTRLGVTVASGLVLAQCSRLFLGSVVAMTG